MGPRELEPPFPSSLARPAAAVVVVKMYQDTNYLQGVEGDIDPAHPNYLHQDLDPQDKGAGAGAGWQSMAVIMQTVRRKSYSRRRPA